MLGSSSTSSRVDSGRSTVGGKTSLRPSRNSCSNSAAGQRLAEIVALHFVAASATKENSVALRFHALGDHRQPQAMRQRDDRHDDGPAFGALHDFAHEGLVDFQPVDGEALEVAQA